MERWISVRTGLATPFEQAVEVLMGDGRVLLADADGPHDHSRLELSVESDAGSGVRQAVEVRLGAPCQAEGEAWVPIHWEPTAHSHLLPSFGGVIEVVEGSDGAELSITGTYGIPLGFVGRFGDGLLGRRVAQQSLRRAVEAMAERLDERANEEFDQASWHPAPYPVALREPATPIL